MHHWNNENLHGQFLTCKVGILFPKKPQPNKNNNNNEPKPKKKGRGKWEKFFCLEKITASSRLQPHHFKSGDIKQVKHELMCIFYLKKTPTQKQRKKKSLFILLTFLQTWYNCNDPASVFLTPLCVNKEFFPVWNPSHIVANAVF